MLTYTESIEYITFCERDLINSEGAEYTGSDDYLRSFDAFQQAKDYHRAQFGSLTKRNGEWA